MGDNAIVQPGHMQEVLLHETAVLWIRLRLASTVPNKAWLETKEQYVCQQAQRGWVEGLCKSLPKRLDLVIEAKGGRISR